MSDRYSTLFLIEHERLRGTDLLEDVARLVLRDSAGDGFGLTFKNDWTDARGTFRVEGERFANGSARWRMQHTSSDRQKPVTLDVRLATAGDEVECVVSEGSSGMPGARVQVSTAPAIVPTLLSAYHGSAFGELLESRATSYDDMAIRAFTDRLRDPNRAMPLVVVTRRNSNGASLVDADKLSRQFAGLATVAVLEDKEASLRLSAEVGQLFSCYDGAIRVYWQHCNPGVDDPYQHPLFFPWTIESDPERVCNDIFNRLCREALRTLPASGPVWRAAGGREATAPAPSMRAPGTVPRAAQAPPAPAPAEPVVDVLSDILDRWKRLRPDPEPAPPPVPEPLPAVDRAPTADEAAATPLEVLPVEQVALEQPSTVQPKTVDADLVEIILRLEDGQRALLDMLAEQDQRLAILESFYQETQLKQAEEAAESTESYRFRNVAEAVRAARQAFPHLVFLPSANRSSRNSPYRYPSRVYSAFQAMEDVAQQRLADPNFGQGMREVFAQYGIVYESHLSDTTGSGNTALPYTFRHKDRHILMEAHIKLGNSRDPANCLRLHFEWDREDGQWVIGHVGIHLPNTLSN